MAYRVIGSDGVERELGGLAEWVAAIRSGAVGDDGLFWNAPEGRWGRVTGLGIYGQARAIANSDGAVLDASADAVPPARMDPPADPEPARPSEAAPEESLPERKRGGRLAFGAAALCLAALAALWWTGAAPAAPESLWARIPWQARAGAAVLIGLVVAEEFYWIALGMLGFRRSTFPTRFAVQALSASLTALALQAAARHPDHIGRWFVWLNQRFGVRAEPDLFDKLAAALGAGDVKSALVLAFVQHAVLLAGLYACAVLATSALLLRLDLVRNLFAGLLLSGMVFGTLYMALAPLAPPPPRRGTDRPPEIRSTFPAPASRPGAAPKGGVGLG